MTDVLENGTSIHHNVSAYLEYTSLADILPNFMNDIEQPAFSSDLLHLSSTNVWLSDGNTLGKLHFDPFDNLLCQVN